MNYRVIYDLSEFNDDDIPHGIVTDWFNDTFGTSARNVVRIESDDKSKVYFKVTNVPLPRLKGTKGFIKTFADMKKLSEEIIEKIKEKFNDPQEFCAKYNAFLMGRLTDKELEKWFLSMPEAKLDEANDWYINNERINKFALDVQALKRKCVSKDQMTAFNNLVKSFSEVDKSKGLRHNCSSKEQRKAFNEVVNTFKVK